MNENSKGPMTYYVGAVIMVACVISVGSLTLSHVNDVDHREPQFKTQR